MCQIAYTKSVYLQIYTDFCPWYFQTIKSDRLHHTMSCVRHLHYTNWRLKICMWQLYFSSWSPEGNLRIFLILSPVLWNLKLLKFVFPGSHKNCFFGVISHNLWRNLETNLERIPSKGRCGYFLELPMWIYLLLTGGEG